MVATDRPNARSPFALAARPPIWPSAYQAALTDAELIDLRCGSIPASGEFGFPGSRKGAFAVAPMLGELEKAMVSGQSRTPLQAGHH